MNESADHALPPSYFDAVYQANADPWNFETSPYETAKYDATLAALPKPRYKHAFEIGCSIGVLTEKLAARCDDLLAVDVAAQALSRAKERCQNLPQVRFELMHLPAQYPDQQFDLTIVSEVGYYWGWRGLKRAQQLIISHLESGGHLLLVHWTPFVPDYPLTGDQVHTAFLNHTGAEMRHLHGSCTSKYRLDLFEKRKIATSNEQ